MRLGEGIMGIASARRPRRALRHGVRLLLLALASTVVACDQPSAPVAVAPPKIQQGETSRLLRLEAVDQRVRGETPIDVWMGTAPSEFLRVRVHDAVGAVGGVAVQFRVTVGGAGTREVAAMTVTTDGAGIAAISDWQVPVTDTVAMVYRVTAQLVDSTTAPSVTITFRAWRDLRLVGDASALMLTELPISQDAIRAIRPMGTFRDGDALPSADAIIIPTTRPQRVQAMSAGVITDIDWRAGAVTVRVRDAVRVRLAGITLRHDLWVGKRLLAGDSLGALSLASTEVGLRVRVLDGSAPDSVVMRSNGRDWSRPSWIRPERYGARATATFFGRYVPVALRSVVYGRVQRAAPDLEGRFGYDQPGRLVGTWFDPAAPIVAQFAPPSSLPSLPSLPLAMDFSAALGDLQIFSTHRTGDVDPSDALGPVALTFAYDAERPGQVRIAAGESVARALGLDAVQTVAWEDPDPATVDGAVGAVRYHLYASDDEIRLGRPTRILQVHMVGSDRLRVEVLRVASTGEIGGTDRAMDFVR